jgi:hypothetical protein
VKPVFIVLLGILALMTTSRPLSGEGTSVGFYGVGGRLSYVSPEWSDATVGLGAHVDLGTLFGLLWLYPSLEYWGRSQSEESLNFERTFTQVSINADVRLIFPAFGGRVLPFLGGGPCMIISANTESYYDPFYGQVSRSDTDISVGLDGLGGVHVPLGVVAVFVEGKWRWSDLDLGKITCGFTISLGQ